MSSLPRPCGAPEVRKPERWALGEAAETGPWGGAGRWHARADKCQLHSDPLCEPRQVPARETRGGRGSGPRRPPGPTFPRGSPGHVDVRVCVRAWVCTGVRVEAGGVCGVCVWGRVYMWVRVYMCADSVCVCGCLWACMRVGVGGCACGWCVYVCMHVHVCGCVRACACTYVCVWACVPCLSVCGSGRGGEVPMNPVGGQGQTVAGCVSGCRSVPQVTDLLTPVL